MDAGGFGDEGEWEAMKPKDIPEGFEVEGWICVVVEGCAWLTKEGLVTTKWAERGVWQTEEDALDAAMKANQKEVPTGHLIIKP